MKFQFDPGKNEINLAKHGVSLAEGIAMWDISGVEADLGMVNGEYRYARLAPLAGTVHIATFTFRAGAIRLISVRAATDKEKQFYEQKKK